MKALNKAWRRCTPRFRRTEIHTVLTGNRSPALAGACPPTFRSISTKGYAERFAVYEKEKSSRLNLSKRSQLGRKRRKASASGTSNSTTEFQDTAHNKAADQGSRRSTSDAANGAQKDRTADPLQAGMKEFIELERKLNKSENAEKEKIQRDTKKKQDPMEAGMEAFAELERKLSRGKENGNGEAISDNARGITLENPPREPSPEECCGMGCNNCVWIVYWDQKERYEQLKAQRDSQSRKA
eukprot:gb/GECG01004596.1/.p1 GENE.gb/GECG01004596.1/~~gb/GECG01004596.1/.p1  ORF type:complete len:241 (+),score=41.13 gb/GECG01004596.1/:1-723(+)